MVDCFPLYLKIRVIYFSRIQFLVTCNAAALFNYKIWFFDFGPKRRFGRLCFVFVFFHWFKATRPSQVPLKTIDGRRTRPEFPFLDCGATSSACKLTRQVNCWFEELAKYNCSLTCFGTTLWPAASGNKIIGGIFLREMCEKRPPERQWVPGLRPAVCDPVWWCISAAGTVSPGPCAANWRKRPWTTISCGWPHWNCCCCQRSQVAIMARFRKVEGSWSAAVGLLRQALPSLWPGLLARRRLKAGFCACGAVLVSFSSSISELGVGCASWWSEFPENSWRSRSKLGLKPCSCLCWPKTSTIWA